MQLKYTYMSFSSGAGHSPKPAIMNYEHSHFALCPAHIVQTRCTRQFNGAASRFRH